MNLFIVTSLNEFAYCYLIKIKHILTNKNYFIYSYDIQAN
jgi:hypothetical protein